jgi:hypothetical protein
MSPSCIDLSPDKQAAQLEAQVQGRLAGRRLIDFRLQLQGAGVVLQGRAPTYYVKQLAQHAVMQATDLPILANEIEVY